MADDDWGKPLKGDKRTAFWFVQQALRKNPALSLLTREAVDAIATIAVDALPVKGDDED